MSEPPLPFSIAWLYGASQKRPEALEVCDQGHLRVNGRTCWTPTGFTPDLGAVYCAHVEHPEE